MLDLALERETLSTLLARRADDREAWSALFADGWFGAVTEPGGAWPLAGVALAVAEIVGAHARTLPVGAHLAAACALAQAGDDRSESESLAVVTGVRRHSDGRLTGDLWGRPDAEYAISVTDGQGVSVSPLSAWLTAPHPLLVLGGLDIRRAWLDDEDAAEPLADCPPADHEARTAFLLGAEAIGAVAGAVQRTVDYLGQRRQFGRPLSTQQALQHRAVDMHLVRLTGSALLAAAADEWATGGGAGASWQAKLLAGDRGLWAAEQAVQLHGGIGFTWELGIHFAVRRALAARLLLGGPERAAREVLARVAPARPGLTDWSRSYVPPSPVE